MQRHRRTLLPKALRYFFLFFYFCFRCRGLVDREASKLHFFVALDVCPEFLLALGSVAAAFSRAFSKRSPGVARKNGDQRNAWTCLQEPPGRRDVIQAFMTGHLASPGRTTTVLNREAGVGGNASCSKNERQKENPVL